MLNQWIESPSYSDHPLCISLLDRACFMYMEHWSTAPPFFTLLDLQLDTTDPIRCRQQPAILTHIYTLTPTNTHATALGWPENEGDSAHSGWKGSHITVKCKNDMPSRKQYRSSPNAMPLNHKCSALLNAPSRNPPLPPPGAQNWLCGITIFCIFYPMSITNEGRWAFEQQRNCTRHTTASENT